MQLTVSSVLSFGCTDSGGSHVHIWRYSESEQQGYYCIFQMKGYLGVKYVYFRLRKYIIILLLQVQRTNAVYSAWLTIPKLSEICWQALNYYYPKLRDCSPDILLHIGIPLKFVQRFDFYDWWTLSVTLRFSNLWIIFLKSFSMHFTTVITLRSFLFDIYWYIWLMTTLFLQFYLFTIYHVIVAQRYE